MSGPDDIDLSYKNVRIGWALSAPNGTHLFERRNKPRQHCGQVLWRCMLAEQDGRTVWFAPRRKDRLARLLRWIDNWRRG